MPDSSPSRLSSSTLDHLSTLLCGATVAISTSRGEIYPDALLGVFDCDERLISALDVRVDGGGPPLLAAVRTSSSSDRISLLAALDKYRNAKALLVRRRVVSVGVVRENLELRSFAGSRTIEVTIELESDGASVLALKSAKALAGPLPWSLDPGGTSATVRRDGITFVSVSVDHGGTIALVPNTGSTRLRLCWIAEVSVAKTWTSSWSINAKPRTDNVGLARYGRGTLPRPLLKGLGQRWDLAVGAGIDDVEALIIEENQHRFIAAGAPWFLALFGRDSLIAAWETLPLGTELALDVLDTLAGSQGTEVNQKNVEQPGKILHERRVGAPQVFRMERGKAYYGSVDSSPLFVMLLAEVYRWGGDLDRVRALLPAAQRAMQWCADFGTDGPGGESRRSPFLWYTTHPGGLGNQSWKDSGDCMVHADGSQAAGPFAVAEVQGYYHDALIGMARLERDLGDPTRVADLEATAAALAADFDEHFWLSEEELLAFALDGEHNPLRVATSNVGHSLWTGILSPARAAQVADRVMRADLRSPWGIRTLGADEVAYNPLGYHLGTVWSHDSAIVAAGLARHGFATEANVLIDALLDAAQCFDWRLPELFCGLDTSEEGKPLPYPAACSPQAWSAGAPLLLLRAALGLNPDVPAGRIDVQPLLTAGSFSVTGLVVGGDPISVSVSDGTVFVTGTKLIWH